MSISIEQKNQTKNISILKTKILFFLAVLVSSVTFSQKKWTLKECVDHALTKNITIQQNKLNIEVSEANVKTQKANFLPSINGSTNGNLSFGSTFDPVSNNRISTSTFGGSLSVNAGITVFNGYRNLNLRKQAELGVESSKLDLKVLENDISLRVINTYLNVLFAKENLAVAETQALISKNQITRAQEQFNAGAIPKGDLLNVQSTAATDAQNVITNENNLNLALLQLAQLIQTPVANFDVQKLEIDSPSVALLYDNASQVYKKALDNGWPEIKRQQLNIDNADLNIKIAKSGYLPSLNANASLSSNYGYNLDLPAGVSNPRFFSQLDNNLGYGLGFSLSVPIFNGFRNDVNVERAKIQKEISQKSLENQKIQLQQKIEQAYLDAKLAAKTYEAAQISLDAQKEAFKNAQVSYNYGSMTQFDFDQVRNRLVNVEASLIRAKYDYVFKTKVLKFYFGENVSE